MNILTIFTAVVSCVYAAGLPAGLSLTTSAITMTSYQQTVQFALNKAITEDVTVTFASSSKFSLSACSLTFKAGQQSVAQPVTVSLNEIVAKTSEDFGALTYSFSGCTQNSHSITVKGTFRKSGSCQSTGDPHVQQFDGATVEAFSMSAKAGTAVQTLIQSSRLVVQATQAQWLGSQTTVNTGCAVFFAGEAVRITINGGKMAVATPGSKTSKIKGNLNSDKTTYTMKMPDNSMVMVKMVSQKYFNIYINVDGIYDGRAGGLCGNFNGNRNDDCKSLTACKGEITITESLFQKWNAFTYSAGKTCTIPAYVSCPTSAPPSSKTTPSPPGTSSTSVKTSSTPAGPPVYSSAPGASSTTAGPTSTPNAPVSSASTSAGPSQSTPATSTTPGPQQYSSSTASAPGPASTPAGSQQYSTPSSPAPTPSTPSSPSPTPSTPSNPSPSPVSSASPEQTSAPAPTGTPCPPPPPTYRFFKRADPKAACTAALSNLKCCADINIAPADLINSCVQDMTEGMDMSTPQSYADTFNDACTAARSKDNSQCSTGASVDAGFSPLEFTAVINSTDGNPTGAASAVQYAAGSSVALVLSFMLL